LNFRNRKREVTAREICRIETTINPQCISGLKISLGLELASDLISEANDARARRSDTNLVIDYEIFRDVDLD
jgi:hypothetical protein